MPPHEVLSLAGSSETQDLVEEWRHLSGQIPGTSNFQTPDWVISWRDTLGGRPPTELTSWRNARGTLEGITALSRVTELLHARIPLRFPIWTNTESALGEADHCGWPVLRERIPEVREWLAARMKAAPLLLRNLDPDTGVPFRTPEARLLKRSVCPRIQIPETLAEPAPGHPSAGRARRRAREIEDAGVRFRWVPPERMEVTILDPLFRFHHERMRAKGWSLTVNPRERDFHAQLIARAGPGRGPAALVAELQGRLIGVEYGFLWRDTFAGFKNGWDPAWAHLRLGNTLLRETIRSLATQGVRVFDLLRGREPYKYEFGPVERCDETWFLPNGPVGRILAMRERALHLVHRDPGFYLW